jgi:hypothetical protein
METVRTFVEAILISATHSSRTVVEGKLHWELIEPNGVIPG